MVARLHVTSVLSVSTYGATAGTESPTRVRHRFSCAGCRRGFGQTWRRGSVWSGIRRAGMWPPRRRERRDAVVAITVIDARRPKAIIPQGLLSQLALVPVPGRLLWRLQSEATIRKLLRAGAFFREVDIPPDIVESIQGMTHRAFASTGRGSLEYMRQRSVPDRLLCSACRCRSSSGLRTGDIDHHRQQTVPRHFRCAHRSVEGRRAHPDARRSTNDGPIAGRLHDRHHGSQPIDGWRDHRG